MIYTPVEHIAYLHPAMFRSCQNYHHFHSKTKFNKLTLGSKITLFAKFYHTIFHNKIKCKFF